MQSAILGKVEKTAVIEGRVKVSEEATLREGSVVRGPAYIGPRTMIGPKSYIGPYTSIGANCKIVNSEIEGSVVLDGVEIIGVSKRMTNSIIGTNSKITGSNERPAGHKLILGEQSLVNI
jgi:glucose-1-phosphate thymidylyltransferase